MDEIPDEYIAGYLDGIQPVRLEVTKSDNQQLGYRIRSSLVFDTHTNQSRGFVDELLRDNFIRYHISKRNEHHKRLKSNSRKSVIELMGIYEDKLLQSRPVYEYVRDELAPDQSSNAINDKEQFVKHIDAIENLFPVRSRGENIKYTTEFFEDEWDVELSDSIDVGADLEPRELSDAYVAGLLDGCGRITVGISKADDRSIGYSFAPRIEFTLTDAVPAQRQSLKQYFNDKGFDYHISNQGPTVTFSLQRIADVEQFLKSVGPELVRHYYTGSMYYSEIVPRIKNGEHTSKQGFFEVVSIAEEAIAHSGRFRAENGAVKYTTEFFEDKWGTEVEPVEMEV